MSVWHRDYEAQFEAHIASQKIYDCSEWEVRKRVLDRVIHGKELNGITLPWAKTHDKVRLRQGEISVWAGYSGHQKTTMLSQVAAWASQTIKVGVASFEMELEDTLALMVQQTAGTDRPDRTWANDFCSWTADRIFIYDRLDAVPSSEVLSAADYMAKELGCGLILIDSLMMCGLAEDDYTGQRRFIQNLIGLAKIHHCHIALVHHMRKPPQGDDSKRPHKSDIRGSSTITDLAASVFIPWSNRAKSTLEQKLELGLSADELRTWERVKDMPDQVLYVDKQRHAPFEGPIGLWRHPSRQFTGTAERRPMPFEIPRLAA